MIVSVEKMILRVGLGPCVSVEGREQSARLGGIFLATETTERDGNILGGRADELTG